MRQGCDHTQPSKMFPYLNISLLNESDKNRLLHRLMDEALNMIEMFACLVCDSFKSLDIQNTPISDLVADTLTFGQNRLPTPFLYSHVQELSAAISVRDVQTFLVMHNYISFFNYGILEKIINRFGMPEDITRLECYLTQFHAFCKRNVFEVSQSVMPNISDSTGDSNDKFVVKVKENLWFGHRQSTHNTQTSLTWEDLYAVQRHIAKVLELDPESLLLCDVVKGCVEVTYTFLTKLTITSSQLSELSSLGIKVLCKSKQREDNSFIKFIEERDTTPEKAAYNLPSEIQFGFHAVTGRNISLSDNGLTASRKDPKYGFNAVVYGATPLKSTSEFEVEIESYNREEWHASLRLGVLRTKMTKAIEEHSIPRCSDDGERYCLWTQGDEIWNRLNGNLNKSKYGDFNLWEVKCSDRVGMHLSRDGNLTFIVNGRRQGLAARNVYKKGYYVYPVVDVCGRTSAVSITRAGIII